MALRGTWRKSIVITATAVTALAGSAPPAAAWLRDFEARTARSSTDGLTPKSASMGCPGGKKAIGSGAFVTGSFADIALNKLWADQSKTLVRGAAAATDAPWVAQRRPAPAWGLELSGYCVSETLVQPTVRTGASYVKDVLITRVRRAAPRGPFDFSNTTTARCPPGRTPIGGGFQINSAGRFGPIRNVVAYRVDRAVGVNGWQVTAYESDRPEPAWSLEATAICANTSTAVSTPTYAGQARLWASSTVSPANSRNKTVTVHCPLTFRVVGGGASISAAGTGDPPAPRDVALTMSRPGGTGSTSDTWVASAVEVDPTTASWQLRARVVCTSLSGPPGG